MVGIALALGANVYPVRALVQGSGSAMRIKAALFRKAFRQSLSLQRAVHLYTHTLMAQIAQTASCNRFHVVEARLACRLMVASERACSNHIYLTHKFLGDMLGERRVGVTEAAYALKQRKLIDYGRGNITITHRRGLEAAYVFVLWRRQESSSQDLKWIGLLICNKKSPATALLSPSLILQALIREEK